jgi:hypothetical protein
MAADIRDTYTQGRSATLIDKDDNTVKKDLLRMRDRLVVGKWYKVQIKSPLHDDGYKLIRHKLVGKQSKFAVFESEKGIRRCLSYFEIAKDKMLYLDNSAGSPI